MNIPTTYISRRLLIAIPSLLGISLVLFTVLALAPGDPFGEIASNPNIPAEVAANLRSLRPPDHGVAERHGDRFARKAFQKRPREATVDFHHAAHAASGPASE